MKGAKKDVQTATELATTSLKRFVSIVIPTYNRPDCLLRSCSSFLEQEYDPYEIIIVDQSEEVDPSTTKFLKSHPSIRYFHLSKPNRCRAKNFGVDEAKGEIVLICDDDVVAPSDLVAKHASHYDDRRIGAVSCRIVEEGQPDAHLLRILRMTVYGKIVNNAHSLHSQYVQMVNGGNMSFRRDLFVRAGYFDESFIGTGIMEEPDISFRITKMGYEIYFDASTTVRHFPQKNGNIHQMSRRRIDWFFSYFYNLAQSLKNNRKYMSLAMAGPFCLALALKQTMYNRLPFAASYEMFRGYLKGAVSPKKNRRQEV